VARSAHRFFVENLDGDQIAVTGVEAHHAAGVLRLKAGEIVDLFDGQGGIVNGAIVSISNKQMVVRCVQRRTEARPQPIIHLGFAVPKGKRLDWLLEKVTELGAASIQPLIFERSVAGGNELSEGAKRRWMAHLIAAAKQSELNFLPQLWPPLPLERFLAGCSNFLCIAGDAGPGAISMAEAIRRRAAGQKVVLLVGPEGGFTDSERNAILSAGFLHVRIGSTVLRIETAAIALLVATVAMCQEM
jgi:16S rRNA (uracil1498-N3)-methyltransferase